MKNKIFIIAEIGQAHDGSLGILHSYIDALSETGVDAVKFQMHIAEAESSLEEPFRVNFSYEDKTRYDYWKRMSFTIDQWSGIKKHCDEVDLEFLVSPFSCAAVDLLETLDVTRYKIGSGEVTNFLMLEKIARTGKPIILSSGMSSYLEINKAIEFLKPYKNLLALLQCTTCYPTPPEKLGLNVLREFRERYPGMTIGLSEHTAQAYASIAAVALGAEIIEFHVVFDRRMFGPDSNSSLTIDEVSELVDQIRKLEISLLNPVDKSDNSEYLPLKNIFEKTLAVNKNLGMGHELTFEDLESKKPAGCGISADEYQSVIGKRLNRALNRYDFITKEILDA